MGSRMSRHLHLLCISVCAGSSLCAVRAEASPVYPAEVQAVVQLQAPPPCTTCHLSELGGDGTAVKPFATTLQNYGLVGDGNLPALRAALAEAEKNKPDSDFDGTDDLSELRAGDDPNDGVDLPTPRTGCSTTCSGAASSLALGAVLIGALLVTARRHAQTRRRIP
jgi:hypothetical protein